MESIQSQSTELQNNNDTMTHKIFICHSSKDKDLIDAFISQILLATGLCERDEIVYSSGGDMGTKAGESIIDFIRQNLKKSSLIFLMMSQNFKKSEVCMNEMGAAWILEKNVVPLLLPNMNCDSVGFLNDKNSAIDILSTNDLSKLVQKVSDTFDRKPKYNAVSEAVNTFIKQIGNNRVMNSGITSSFSMQDIKQDAATISNRIKADGFYPSLIFGIGRGGAIFGSLISYNLCHAPVFVIDRQYNWDGNRIDGILFDFDIPSRFLDRVLVVAGETHTGNTLKFFSNYLYSKGATNIKTCVYYKQGGATCALDYFCKEGTDFPLMPWQEKDYIRDSINAECYNELQNLKNKYNPLINKNIFIVRHGETSLNKEDKFLGSTNISLSPTGTSQSNAVGQFLKDELGNAKIKLYSSNQKRGKETADAILTHFTSSNCVCVTDDRLRERDYGSWEGKSRKWLRRNCLKDYKSYENDPIRFSPDDAETILSVIKRVNDIWNEIANDNAENVIIVTHKTTGRILLTLLENGYYTQYRNIPFENCALYKFVIKNHEINLDITNKQF